jgi:hypothetical protein
MPRSIDWIELGFHVWTNADEIVTEGVRIDDEPWNNAGRHARDHHRHVSCGPAGPDREALAGQFHRTKNTLAFRREHCKATRMTACGDLSGYWLRVSGFAGPGTVSDHRKTRDRGVDAMIL